MLTNPCQEPGHDYTGVACQKCFKELVEDRDRAMVALRRIVFEGDAHELMDCPQDDTCECVLAKEVNTLIKKYPAKQGRLSDERREGTGPSRRSEGP